MRFELVVILVFWCFSLCVTVFQQSSLLSDLENLWQNRLDAAKRVETELAHLSQLTESAQSIDDVAAASAKSLASVEDDHRHLTSRVLKLQKQLVADNEEQEDDSKKNRHVHSSSSLPPLRPMRTTCHRFAINDALKKLVTTSQDKLFESDPNGMLRELASGRGIGSPDSGAVMDRELSSLDADMEATLEHLEATMPKVVEKWARWFKESGQPVPAPLFDVDAEEHRSAKAGRAIYEAAKAQGEI